MMHKYRNSRVKHPFLPLTTAVSFLLTSTVIFPYEFSYSASNRAKLDPVLVLKDETSRNVDKHTNEKYGVVTRVTSTDLNYFINTKKSFIFAVAHTYIDKVVDERDNSKRKEFYKNKYFHEQLSFVNTLTSYAYTSQKEILLTDFNTLNNSYSVDINKLFKTDYFGQQTNFGRDINAEGSSYEYEDNTSYKKPRLILGVVKEGKLYDYITYRDDPILFSIGGIPTYLNNLTYTSNIYNAYKKEAKENNLSTSSPNFCYSSWDEASKKYIPANSKSMGCKVNQKYLPTEHNNDKDNAYRLYVGSKENGFFTYSYNSLDSQSLKDYYEFIDKIKLFDENIFIMDLATNFYETSLTDKDYDESKLQFATSQIGKSYVPVYHIEEFKNSNPVDISSINCLSYSQNKSFKNIIYGEALDNIDTITNFINSNKS